MSKPVKGIVANSFGGLFADCSTRCTAYAACGGSRESAPCGCAWPASSEKRHKCDECSIICRERKKTGMNGLESDFDEHLNAGSLLDQVVVRQNSEIKLPLFIPTNTHYLKNDELPLPLHYVAADIRMLFNTRAKQPAALKPHFATPQSTQKYLRVNSNCNLIAILNGKDSYLESFWAMKRSKAFKQLRMSGFSIGTGATFSVTDLTYRGTPTPYAHNATMLMRHHRTVYEIQDAGMEAIPNIYWIDGDRRELKRWAEWLMKNIQIHTVSRDFTSTRTPKAIMSKLQELISLLNKVGRSFHVLIIGTGCKMAPLVLRELAKAGYSGSIVTSAPIQHAFRNVKYRLDSNSQIIDVPSAYLTTPFSDLMRHNMEVFERALWGAIAGTEAELVALPNILQLK